MAVMNDLSLSIHANNTKMFLNSKQFEQSCTSSNIQISSHFSNIM